MKRTTAEKPANEEHAFVTTYPRKGGKDMGKKDELLTGAIRRDALTRLTREERMKYELAREQRGEGRPGSTSDKPLVLKASLKKLHPDQTE